jgi:hypothetical protein
MAVNLSPVGGAAAQFFTNTGDVLTGGKLYTYLAGTTTPAATYTSSNGATAWANPIVLDAAGRVPSSGEIWLTAGVAYKFVLKDSTDVLIGTYDNITGINGTGIASNASQVTYDPAGTGAVATTVQAKLRQFVSVMDFGATGNGVTDDTTAIQTALNSASQYVIFPAGSYKITVSIKPSPNQTLAFYGSSLIVNSAINAIEINQSNVTIQSAVIKSATNGVWSGFYGIYVTSPYATLIDCIIRDITYNAVLLNSTYARVENLSTFNCGWDSVTFFENADYNYVANLYSYRSGRSAVGSDVGATGNVVDGAIVIDNGSPLVTGQHHDVFHFEGAINSTFRNCDVFYTTNHPAHSTGLVDVNCVVRFNKGTGNKAENISVNYATNLNKTVSAIVCDQQPNDVVVNNFTFVNTTAGNIPSTLSFESAIPGVVAFNNCNFSGPSSFIDNQINGSVPVQFNNCTWSYQANSDVNYVYYNPALTIDVNFNNCTFENCNDVINAYGWQNGSIRGCTFRTVAGIAFQTRAFSFDATYRPSKGTISNNTFSGVINKCFDLYESQAPIAITNNIFEGTITTMVLSNGSVGGVGTPISRWASNMVTGTVTNMNASLNADANQ